MPQYRRFGDIGGGKWSPPPKAHAKPKSDGAVVFEDYHVAPNTSSSLMWADIVDTENTNQATAAEQLEKYTKDKPPPPSKRKIRRVGSRMMYVSDPKNTDPSGYEPKPKKLEEVISVPRGLKYIPPPKLFRSQYNQGCYAPYKPPASDEMPAQHVMARAQALHDVKPGHGASFRISGAKSLAPTRFLKGKATKAWVEYVGTTGRNNHFRNLTTTANAANKEAENRVPHAMSFKQRAALAVQAATQPGEGSSEAGQQSSMRPSSEQRGRSPQKRATTSMGGTRPGRGTTSPLRPPQQQQQQRGGGGRASSAIREAPLQAGGSQPRPATVQGMRSPTGSRAGSRLQGSRPVSRLQGGSRPGSRLTEREAVLAAHEVNVDNQMERHVAELTQQIAQDNKYLFCNPQDKYYRELARKNMWDLRQLYKEGAVKAPSKGMVGVLDQPMDQRLWVNIPEPDQL